MKVTVDGKDIFTLTETQKKVIQNDISSEVFDEDMKRRLFYIIDHKYRQCFKRLKDEWDKKLEAAGVESIPTNKDAYAELVFARPEYMDRKAKDEAAAANLK